MDAAPTAFVGTSVRFLGVFAAAALALRALDGVPAFFLGPEERTFPTVAELERSERVQLLLPSYFPDTLTWPPSGIRASSRPAAAVLTFDGAARGGPRVVLVQALQAGAGIDHLAAEGVVLERSLAADGPQGATFALVKAQGGATWRELEWEHEGRRVRMRSLGPLDELVRMAKSVRRERR